MLKLSLFLTASVAIACGEPNLEADADVEPFPCQLSDGATPSDTVIALALGYDDSGSFVEITDSEPTPVVRGRQGFFMIVTKLQTTDALSSDSFCLTCRQRVSPVGTFDGVDYEAGLFFRRNDSDDFLTTSFLVMGGDDLETVLDGATATISVECSGHGVGGSVSQTTELFIAGDFASP